MLKKIITVVAIFAFPTLAMAADGTPMGEGAFTSMKAALALGAGLAIGTPAFGGAWAQGRAAAAALEGIARNPEASGKVMTPMIIGLALIESLVLYALVISFMLMGKI